MELLEVDCRRVQTDSPLADEEILFETDEPEDILKKDLWSFGYFWSGVLARFSTVSQLYSALKDLKDLTQSLKKRFSSQSLDYSHYRVEPNSRAGVSGSYLLVDDRGSFRYIVKPLDEDGGCIHSPRYPSPFTMSPFRENISLYHSAMREVLASLVADQVGVGSVVPKTTLGVIESDCFHDLSDQVSLDELGRYFEEMGAPDRNKLCSIQEYVEGSKSVFEAVHELEMSGLTDDEITLRFDQESFEDANILLWTSYDNDGHMGNFLVYPKGVDEIGNEILGLKKIDNGLAFPEINIQFRNSLAYLPNATLTLSERAKAIIANIDVEALASIFEKMGLESSIDAMKARIPFLKTLAQTDGITIKEINKKMSTIGRKNETLSTDSS